MAAATENARNELDAFVLNAFKSVSTRRSLKEGRRTGVQLRRSLVKRDSDYLDDVDDFWKATQAESTDEEGISDVEKEDVTVNGEQEEDEVDGKKSEVVIESHQSPSTLLSSSTSHQQEAEDTKKNDGDDDVANNNLNNDEDEDGDGDDDNADENSLTHASPLVDASPSPSPRMESTNSAKKTLTFSTAEKAKRLDRQDSPVPERFSSAEKVVTDREEASDGDGGEEMEETEDGTVESPKKKDTRKRRKRRAMEVTPGMLSDSDEYEDDEAGLRRSKRTSRPPLKWWKNERPLYERTGTGVGAYLPVVKGVALGQPTPQAKPRRRRIDDDGNIITKEERKTKDNGALIASELPENFKYMKKEETAVIWDEKSADLLTLRVIQRSGKAKESDLPMTSKRPEGRTGVGRASQAFNFPGVPSVYPGWMSGRLTLPPKAIKDAEGVGPCSQIFFVSSCQKQSLEVALAMPSEPVFNDETAQRFLLSKGDQFFVPPNNVYRLENHSPHEECHLFWSIIQPINKRSGSKKSEKNRKDSS